MRGATPEDITRKIGHRDVDSAKKSDYQKVSGLNWAYWVGNLTIAEQKDKHWRSHWDIQRLTWGIQGSKLWSNIRELPRTIYRFWAKQ